MKKLYYYNQLEYGDVAYNRPDGVRATVKSGGCGVCSACIVFNTLAQKELYSVEEMAKFSISCGARANSGTDELTLVKALCKAHKEFSYKTTNDVDELLKHLENGGMAICNQGDAYNVFSNAGHYVVACGTDGGSIEVADPSNTATKYDLFNRPKRIVKKTAYGCAVKPSEMKKATADREPAYYLISCAKPAVKKIKYFKRCGSSYVSLVDALYSVGARYTFAYRKKIAKSNGIKAYFGTPKQNVKLLKLLKKGKLIKP